MVPPRVRLVLTAFLTVVAFAVTAPSMTIVVRDDGALADAADAVVHATVTGSKPVLHDNGRVYTHVRLAVHEVWKGDIGASEVELVEMGGATEGVIDWVPGVPRYSVGEEVVTFLVRGADKAWSTADAWSGRFRVAETGAGTLILFRGKQPSGLKLYGPRFEPFLDRPREFEGFRAWIIARQVGVPINVDYRVSERRIQAEGGAALRWDGDAPAQAKWGLLGSGNARWAIYDSGSSESWWYGNDPQIGFVSGSTSGNGPAEFGRSLTTWSDDPSSSVGMTNSGEHTPYGDGWAGGTDGYSEVLFNDPYNEISGNFSCSSGGVLGFGGIHGVSSSHTFRGSTWWSAVEGDVVMQSWTEDCSWLDSESLTEILQHELGHTLGLGHSYDDGESGNTLTDDALMRWLAHGGSLADVLGEDDRCAIYWLYPEARVDLELSPNSSVTASPSTVSPSGSTTVQVALDDGSGAVSGQIVRAWVETASGSATGTLSRGKAYPDAPFLDNGDGTYEATLTVGPGTGTLTVHVEVNCCDDAVPAPPYPCDGFTETASVTVASGPIDGDANGDGQVDGADLVMMVEEIFDGDGTATADRCDDGPCPEPEVDGDDSGVIDANDMAVALTKIV